MKPFIVIAAALPPLAAVASSFPSIEIHSQTYESACNATQWKSIQESLEGFANGRGEKKLTTLVRTWLCESGRKADATIRRHAVARIPSTSEQTGILGSERSYVARSELSALGGRAWYASVQSSDGKVSVSYYPNEACVASVTFTYRREDWLFVSINGACD